MEELAKEIKIFYYCIFGISFILAIVIYLIFKKIGK